MPGRLYDLNFLKRNTLALAENAAVLVVIHVIGTLAVGEVFELEIFPYSLDAGLDAKRFTLGIHADEAAQDEVDKGRVVIILAAVLAARDLSPLLRQHPHVPDRLERKHHLVDKADPLAALDQIIIIVRFLIVI